jgi:hypothetical protein
MLKHAFKEWAVICKALAEGRQALILRKGGIDEADGDFAVEHTRFWLYPTWTHQQRDGVRPEAVPLLEQAEAERPPANVLRLSHFAEVLGVYHVRELTPAMMLAHLHLWSDATVEKRFAYRTPGLYVLPVRVWQAQRPHELPERAEYAGCHSWVELEQELSTEGTTAVLTEQKIKGLQEQLALLLNPTALA